LPAAEIGESVVVVARTGLTVTDEVYATHARNPAREAARVTRVAARSPKSLKR
jgi:hypothetical protein